MTGPQRKALALAAVVFVVLGLAAFAVRDSHSPSRDALRPTASPAPAEPVALSLSAEDNARLECWREIKPGTDPGCLKAELGPNPPTCADLAKTNPDIDPEATKCVGQALSPEAEALLRRKCPGPNASTTTTAPIAGRGTVLTLCAYSATVERE